MPAKIDITGQRYGRLVVVEEAARRGKSTHTQWLCECDCGNRKIVAKGNLQQGKIVSCGCHSRDQVVARNFKHGHAVRGEIVPEHGVWRQMINRCENPKYHQFEDYGGRGIKVCSRWRHDFAAFYADMGPRPSKQHQIERVNNNRGYGPDNCEWVLPEINGRNKRCKKKSATQVRGVRETPCGTYAVSIGVSRSRIYIGTFKTIEQAAQARKKAEARFWRVSSEAIPSQPTC